MHDVNMMIMMLAVSGAFIGAGIVVAILAVAAYQLLKGE